LAQVKLAAHEHREGLAKDKEEDRQHEQDGADAAGADDPLEELFAGDGPGRAPQVIDGRELMVDG
jgi:hypothetical protein